MESVFFLIDTLGKQITTLNDINTRCDRLYKMVNDFLTTLHYSKSASKQKSRQTVLQAISGGAISSFDVEGILTFDSTLTQPENVLNVIYQIEMVWPYIKAKVDLFISTVKSSYNQSLVCKKLADSLSLQLQDNFQKNTIDKVTLIAFNSDMAQLDARISILIFVSQSLFDDIKDMNVITNYVYKLASQQDLIPILKLLADSSNSMFELINEINELAKVSMGAPLINPRFLDVTNSKEDTQVEKIIDSTSKTIQSLKL